MAHPHKAVALLGDAELVLTGKTLSFTSINDITQHVDVMDIDDDYAVECIDRMIRDLKALKKTAEAMRK